jgi:hypothetical protein
MFLLGRAGWAAVGPHVDPLGGALAVVSPSLKPLTLRRTT